MEKKTILMLPSWYPTKENPFQGSFFREQAIIVQDKFDFIVFHLKYKNVPLIIYLFHLFFSKNKAFINNQEFNITEYTSKFFIPVYFKFYIIAYNFIQKIILKRREDGTGSFVPESYISFLRKKIKKILRKSKEINYDFVYGVTAQDKAIEAQLFACENNKPYILAEHAPFPWPGTTISDKQKLAIENADLFLAISNDKIRQVLLQNIKLKNIKYIGNLVDEKMFPFEPVSHAQKTFLIVAANSFYKQYSMLIKTFDELKKLCNKEFKLIIAGYNANKGYSKKAEELTDQLKASSFFENVELIPRVERKELYKLYNRSDCFIMTSIQEGQPVSALEAACCGLPVFSTRCGGVEDYITSENGRIFEITDYKSFALSLNDFLNDKLKFDKQKIRKIIISKFGINAFINNFTECFEKLGE